MHVETFKYFLFLVHKYLYFLILESSIGATSLQCGHGGIVDLVAGEVVAQELVVGY